METTLISAGDGVNITGGEDDCRELRQALDKAGIPYYGMDTLGVEGGHLDMIDLGKPDEDTRERIEQTFDEWKASKKKG